MFNKLLKFFFDKKASNDQNEVKKINESLEVKYLIVGLGNPGSEYNGTRHNIGFNILDALALDLNTVFKSDNLAQTALSTYKGKSIMMVKPMTFMNLSGKAVRYWMQKHNVPKENILVVLDDLHLELGQIRIRPGGSDAGHNGLKSIDQMINGNNYPRLRFGIGNNFPKGRQSDYVLGKWDTNDESKLQTQIPLAISCIKSFCFAGMANTMSTFNKSSL